MSPRAASEPVIPMHIVTTRPSPTAIISPGFRVTTKWRSPCESHRAVNANEASNRPRPRSCSYFPTTFRVGDDSGAMYRARLSHDASGRRQRCQQSTGKTATSSATNVERKHGAKVERSLYCSRFAMKASFSDGTSSFAGGVRGMLSNLVDRGRDLIFFAAPAQLLIVEDSHWKGVDYTINI